MEAAAKERETRKARKPAHSLQETNPVTGALRVTSVVAPMVKVPARGFKEAEIRCLFEKYAEGVQESCGAEPRPVQGPGASREGE